MKINKSWFTLIEIIVSVSILSIIMVSIFSIFQIIANLNNKIDVSRSMQENIKNIVETIAEDVRKNWISWVNSDVIVLECWNSAWEKYNFWTKLCVWNNSYYIAKKVSWVWNRVWDFAECDGKNQCFLVRNNWETITQLSNSWIDFKDLSFWVFNSQVKKLTINFRLKPSILKWIRPNIIDENEIVFQTTISQRLYNDY